MSDVTTSPIPGCERSEQSGTHNHFRFDVEHVQRRALGVCICVYGSRARDYVAPREWV